MDGRKPYFILLILLFLTSCVDIPDEVTLPRWDAKVNLPAVDSVYTLKEAIEDDSLFLVKGDQLIYYSKADSLTKIEVEGNLSIDETNSEFNTTIDTIKVNDVNPVSLEIPNDDWSGGAITSSGNYVVTKLTRTLSYSFDKITAFENVTLNKGKLKLNIFNPLPIDISLSNIEIYNKNTNEIIISRTEPINLISGDSTYVEFDVVNKVVLNELGYTSLFSTNGSNGQSPFFDYAKKIIVKSELQDLEIVEAKADIPDQPEFDFNDTYVFDDSTYLTGATIKSGGFHFNIQNNLPGKIDINFSIPQLKKTDGSVYSLNVSVPKGSSINIDETNIEGWKIVTNKLDNSISYSGIVKVYGSNGEVVDIKSTDGVKTNISFDKLVFSSVSGKIKPTNIDVKESEFDLDLSDLNSKLAYSSIKLDNNSEVFVDLDSKLDVGVQFNGTLSIKNDQDEKVINIDNVFINKNGLTRIDLRNFGVIDAINSFKGKLPNKFLFKGKAVANPNYENDVVINSSDYIESNLTVNLPLSFAISNASFKDTVELDLTDVERKDLEAVKNIKLNLEFINNIATSASVKGELYDKQGNLLMNLLPDYNQKETIDLLPAEVNSSGFAVNPSVTKQVITINSTDILNFTDKRDLVLEIKFNTPSNNSTVKFRSSDYIRYKAFVEVDYIVNN